MTDVFGSAAKGSAWLGMLDPMPWADGAPCSQTDPDLFQPLPGHAGLEAKRICWGSCDVRETCLQYAVDNQIEEGVWGGATSRERWKMRRGTRVTLEPAPVRKREPKPTPVIKCRWCATMFEGHSSSRYCSDRCRVKATAARKRRDAA